MALTDYIIIPGADYQSICNATRTKTGKTDLLKSGEVANEILSITTGGGGSSEGVPYIVQTSKKTTNTIKTNVAFTQTLNVPKGATIVAVYAAFTRNTNTSGTYPMVDNAEQLRADEYTVEAYNDQNDRISYTFAASTLGYAAKNTFILMAQYVCTGVTLSPRSDGLFDAVLTDPDDQILSLAGSHNFVGVKSSQHFGSISFADGVTSVADGLCYGQSGIESVDLAGITEIRDFAFRYCRGLKSVDLTNVQTIGTYAFEDCTSLESITFGSQYTEIGSSAFSGCSSLAGTFVVPDWMTTIPNYCFYRTSFTKVIFPSGFTEIGAYAFSTDESSDLVIAAEYDFSACSSIPTMTGSNSFGIRGNGQVIKVPSALFDEWSTATYWKDYAAHMVAV